jgi:hypothetical protein
VNETMGGEGEVKRDPQHSSLRDEDIIFSLIAMRKCCAGSLVKAHISLNSNSSLSNLTFWKI